MKEGPIAVADRSEVRRWGVLFLIFWLRVFDLRDGDPFDVECTELSSLGMMKLGSTWGEVEVDWESFEGLGVRWISEDLRLLVAVFGKGCSGDGSCWCGAEEMVLCCGKSDFFSSVGSSSTSLCTSLMVDAPSPEE